MESVVIKVTVDEFLGQNSPCLTDDCSKLQAYEQQVHFDTGVSTAADAAGELMAERCSKLNGCLLGEAQFEFEGDENA